MSESFLSPHYSHYYPDLVIVGGEGPHAFGIRANLLTGSAEEYAGFDDEYIDASSQWGVLVLGYGHPRLNAEMHRVIDSGLTHVSAGNFNHCYQYPFMRALAEKMPKSFEWRVSLAANSGAEAIEKALKLARYNTGKTDFVSLVGSFHGRTTGAMSLGTAALLQKDKFGNFLYGVYHASVSDQRSLEALEGMFYPARERVAAFFVEPVQGVGGCNAIAPAMMKAIRDFCTRNKVLMIADEVQSGFGRTGKFWAFEHSGVVPDIVCAAKPLGGGIPSGAIIAKKEIMDWPEGCDGSTFGGNPVACAAGLELLKIIDDQFLVDVEAKSRWFKTELQRRLSCDVPKFGDWNWVVDGVGFMLAINTPSKEFRRKVMDFAYEEKLLVATAEPAAIRLLPPLNISEEVMLQIVDVLTRSITNTVNFYLNETQ